MVLLSTQVAYMKQSTNIAMLIYKFINMKSVWLLYAHMSKQMKKTMTAAHMYQMNITSNLMLHR